MIQIEQKGEPYLPYEEMVSLKDYKPKDIHFFELVVEVSLSEKGQKCTDNYQIQVCTTKWLSEELKKNGKPIFLSCLLLVEKYEPEIISNRISEMIRSTTGDTWDEYHGKLSKYFNREF